MSKKQVKALQRDLNKFTKKYLLGIAPLIVDGKIGHSTLGRVVTCKYYLGYDGRRKDINIVVNHDFRMRLRYPHSRKYTSYKRLMRSYARRSKQRRDYRKNHQSATKTSGVGRFDGRPVANVALPYLKWARQNGWRGTLNSGWRDPVYSKSLCINMCGRPSCPGRCAGLASNHVGQTKTRFAVDVSDYVRFGQLMRQCPIQPRIFNSLGARDPVHFSPSGN